MRPLPRTWKAMAIAFLMTVLGVAAAGFATDDPGASAARARLDDLPPPHVGDEGRYVRTFDDGSEDPLDVRSWNFTWGPDRAMYDRQGDHHWTNVVTLNHTRHTRHDGTAGWAEGLRIYDLDQATHRVVARTWSQYEPWHGDEDALGLESWGSGGHDTHTRFFDPAATLRPLVDCGLFWDVVDEVAGPRVWSDACHIDNEVIMTDPGGWFEVAATGIEAGNTWWELQRIAPPNAAEAIGYVETLRFQSDVAYPTEIRIKDQGPGPDYTLRLSLSPGQGPPAGTAASERPGLPPLEFAPAPAWGVHGDGIGLPYPPGQAWRDALEDPVDTRLTEFLDAHPDAYVASATFEFRYSEYTNYPTWWFHVTDGEDTLFFCSARQEAATVGVHDPRPRISDLLYDHQQCGTSSAPEPWPVAPTTELRPTAASMAARWTHIAQTLGLTDPANSVTMSMSPEGYANITPGTPYYSIGIAEQFVSSTPMLVNTPLNPWEYRTTVASLSMNADGTLSGFHQRAHTLRFEGGSFWDDVPAPDPSEPRPAGASVHVIDTWQWPGLWQTSSIGLLALVVALLYWAWPTLQQGAGVGLFSRISRPTALEQQRRAEIAATIEAEPGIHFEALCRRAGLARGVVRHHVDKLVDTGIVGRRRQGGFTCYHLADGVDVREVDAMTAVKSEVAARVVQKLGAHPGLAPGRLAEQVDASRQSVSYHLRRLESAGLLRRERLGRDVSVRLTPLGERLLPHVDGGT